MREWLRASGYLAVLVPPVLLAVGLCIGIPWLAGGAAFVIAPFLRLIFGDVASTPHEWSEQAATALDRLPVAYTAVFAGCLGVVLWQFGHGAVKGWAWLGAGFSLWVTFTFATAVGHELVHHRRSGRRRLGRVLGGMVGYPIIGHEHMPHHATSGNVLDAEWPAMNENLWAFAARRSRRVLRSAFEYDFALSQRRGGRWRGGLAEACAGTVVTWAAFGWAAGLPGVLLFAVLIATVGFAMQAITYLQHWGLGSDSVSGAGEGQFAWEDGCRLQGWMTLSISFHHAHHLQPGLPYYRLTPRPGSPRLPAGYVILLLAALVPPLWRKWMRPALEHWKCSPERQLTPGRRLVCFYGLPSKQSDA